MIKPINDRNWLQCLGDLPSIVRNERNLCQFLFAKELVTTGMSGFFSIRRDRYNLRFHPPALSVTRWVGADQRKADEMVWDRFLKPTVQTERRWFR